MPDPDPAKRERASLVIIATHVIAMLSIYPLSAGPVGWVIIKCGHFMILFDYGCHRELRPEASRADQFAAIDNHVSCLFIVELRLPVGPLNVPFEPGFSVLSR